MRENRLMRVLSCLHSVLLMMPVCPAMYAFYRERRDAALWPMFATAAFLLLCAFPMRMAALRLKSLWAYLAAGTASLLCAASLAWTVGGRYFGGNLRLAFMLVFAAEGIFIMEESARIRMREKRRKKAEEDNDISYTEIQIFLEKPMAICTGWFGLVYLAGLMTACPPVCDMGLACGLAYLFIWLIYRDQEASVRFLSQSSHLANVPVKKIRRIRKGILLILLLMVCAASLPAMLTAGRRTYRDLRYQEFSLPVEPVMEMELFDMEPPAGEGWEEWLPLDQPVWEPPWWLEYVGTAFMYLCLTAVFIIILRGIAGYFIEFSGRPEENADVAVSLKEDTARRLHDGRRAGFGRGLSERERVRRQYRRLIRKYRKSRPLPCETPTQIEAQAVFPQSFDLEALHEDYEKARYS
ncbi:MAG: hypothetical protein IKE03_06245 [Blautia sp.]|nr:hypothetical protein [Blautia sp.]